MPDKTKPDKTRPDKITGHLEVGTNDLGEVIINFPFDIQTDESGWHFVAFSPRQARNLAKLLILKAALAEKEPK